MGFTHYYKIRVYVDDGLECYKTTKYVFANTKKEAMETVLRYYNSQYDTYAKICEVYDYQIQDVMMFDHLLAIK